jgi:dTDP-4-amino-4,6-dideoxygalactose transaminase
MPDNDGPIPLLDLKAQLETIRPEVERAVLGVISEQRFILGPEVEGLEREVATYTGTAHAVGVSSGTDALLLTLMALGVGPGDEVVTSAYSFFATAGSIARLGARPVLVDIDPADFNLDPAAVAAHLSPRTRAILPVHLFGRCAAVERLREAAPDLPVVEDAAQAIGARRGGIAAGALGTAGCLSFFPSKNLGGCGDGGMITTEDPKLAHRLRALRVHGQERRGAYQHDLLGGNFRLDALQAAVLRVKLPHLERWIEARRANAARYRRLFADSGAPVVLPPDDGPECRDVYNQFVIRVSGGRRDALAARLKERRIGCAIYYPRGLHQQPCLASLGYRDGDFPHTEAAARESLSIPVYPELDEGQQQRVVAAIGEFLDG